MKISFGHGLSDFLFDLETSGILSAEHNQEEIIELLPGAEATYCSLTGLTGEMFIPRNNRFILFGCYNINNLMQSREVVHRRSDGHRIWGYVPVDGHDGYDADYPVVLTDGTKVVFTAPCRIKRYLTEWDNIEGKEIKVIWYKRYQGGPTEKRISKYYLYNPEHYKGVDMRRFIDLRVPRKQLENFVSVNGEYSSQLEDLTHTIQTSKTEIVHVNRLGFVDDIQVVEQEHNDPDWDRDVYWDRDVWDLPHLWGWDRVGNEFNYTIYRKLVGFKFHYIIQEKLDLFNPPEGYGDEIAHYEMQVGAYENQDKAVQELIDGFMKKVNERIEYLKKRAEEDRISKLDKKGLIWLMQKCEKSLSVEMARELGFCEPGIKAFLRRFKLPNIISVKKLAEHPEVEAMLKNPDFLQLLITTLNEK